MKIYGTFKDSEENIIKVEIYNINKTGNNINIDTCDWIRFTDDPVTITTECDDTFVHIIKKSCKIDLLSKRWLGDYLFADNATSIVVNVFRTINNVTTCLFAGYVTPCSYNQDYANAWDRITINCDDTLSILQYRAQNDEMTWDELKAQSTVRSFKDLMERMHLTDNTLIISNMPDTQTNTTQWVETGFERVSDYDGSIIYYVTETLVKILDANTAVTTTDTRRGHQLTPTYVQSQETIITDGSIYYKDYAYVTVNGEQVNTGDWIKGQQATSLLPTIVDTTNVLDGWSYGAHLVPFEYYEHFRIDNVMSDGSIKRGSNDTIGDMIPEEPLQTTLGSYWELRQGSSDDLDYDERDDKYYYKNYAWIIMHINGMTAVYKTGDWMRGEEVDPDSRTNNA